MNYRQLYEGIDEQEQNLMRNISIKSKLLIFNMVKFIKVILI